MNLYAHDLSVLDFNLSFSDPYGEPFSHLRASSAISTTAFRDVDDNVYRASWGERNKRSILRGSPPKHRHDGSSPLPLGMDWSPPPRKWDGQDSLWPHDPPTGWSYCVTIPSWTSHHKSSGSDPVFYKVQVGLQSPESITSTRGISRRFNEFLELFSELTTALPKKHLPPAPPKRVLRMKNNEFHEERRSSLEEWMERLLSDIDVSRSVPVANFLELEAAVRSFFSDVNHQASDEVSSNNVMVLPVPQTSSTASIAAASSIASSPRDDTCYEVSELAASGYGDEGAELGMDEPAFEKAGTDMEDFVARLNQEVAVGQFLTAKDEKVHTESTKMSILEDKILLQGLDASREQLEDLQKKYEEFVTKSKADVKLLVKEVKSLQGTQSNLKQEFSQLIKEKSELQRILQTERQRMEDANVANQKLLHDCEILHNRLQDCSVKFLIEEEDKLILKTSSMSDAIDMLATSDNCINLLLAEAKLLAQDVKNADGRAGSANPNESDQGAFNNALRKMLRDFFVENARLRKQVNSVVRCALNVNENAKKDVGDKALS